MNTNELNAAWAAVNVKAQALADHALAGAALDDLLFARRKLFHQISQLMQKVALRHPVPRDQLNRLLDDLCGANAHYSSRFRNIRRAVEQIAMLRHAFVAERAA